ETKSGKGLADGLSFQVYERDGQADRRMLVGGGVDGNAGCYHAGRISGPDDLAGLITVGACRANFDAACGVGNAEPSGHVDVKVLDRRRGQIDWSAVT